MKLAALGRLLRLSLAPSAAADAVAGIVFASGGRFPTDPRAWWLVPASLGVYHGALCLNDWNDRDHDARTRPSRPLPSRAVSASLALGIGLALIVGGLAAAGFVSGAALAWMSAVAALALVYDFAGRGPWLGPLLLALCRAGNLGCAVFALPGLAGHDAVGHGIAFASFAPCVAYGTYVFLVSRLGRMEDAEDSGPLERRPARLLNAIACVQPLLVLVAAFGTPVPPSVRAPGLAVALGVSIAGAWALRATAATTPTWTRALVERAMGLCLRRLLLLTACVALSVATFDAPDAWIAAAAILAGYPIAHALRRVFPPS